MGQTFELEHDRRVASNGNGVVNRPVFAAFETELDDMRARVVELPNQDPSEVLATISGLAGRLAEIRATLWRDNSQRAAQLRAREVDPLREDLDLQFKIHSRRIALMEWELRLSGGGI